MPRMSQKKRQEMAFFINESGRIRHNPRCLKCARDCKQSFRAILVACPKYNPKPVKT